MASGVADAIFIKQLLEEIQEHIGIKTFLISDKHPVSNKPLPCHHCLDLIAHLRHPLFRRWASIVDPSTSSSSSFGYKIIIRMASSRSKWFLLRKVLPTSSPKMCQHRPWPNIFLLVVFKNFVSERGTTTITTTATSSFPTPSSGRAFHQALPEVLFHKNKKKKKLTTSLTSTSV